MIFKSCKLGNNSSRISKFTFQSGDIQIKQLSEVIQEQEPYLHSNLVIFKLKMIEYSNYNSYRFTFQSGDIQIRILKSMILKMKLIYIPIW